MWGKLNCISLLFFVGKAKSEIEETASKEIAMLGSSPLHLSRMPQKGAFQHIWKN